jgi:DNA modification methylase
VYLGNVLDALKALPDESVHCCITSPPYWGLRDYGLPPQIWDGVNDCQHEWSDEKKKWHGGTNAGEKQVSDRGAFHNDAFSTYGFCVHCGAWRGSLGLEPTPELYVQHFVQIFREVRRVLRKDGTVWLNLGDSYIAAQGGRQSKVGEMPGSTIVRKDQKREREEVDVASWSSRDVTTKVTPMRGTTALKPKDLAGIPWRVAFALQADGWYLRSDIIWSKPNPMPESVRDRPTKSHEYIFLLSKSPTYFYDADAIREPHADAKSSEELLKERAKVGGSQRQAYDFWVRWKRENPAGSYLEFYNVFASKKVSKYGNEKWENGIDNKQTAWGNYATYLNLPNPAGRNKRTVWVVTTEPYKGAHFATYPEKLVEPCIKAGTSEKGCCAKCGAPYQRIVKTHNPSKAFADYENVLGWANTHQTTSNPQSSKSLHRNGGGVYSTSKMVGWSPTCNCNTEVASCTVLDIFAGSGTTLAVAQPLGRRSIGIELNPKYVELIRERCSLKPKPVKEIPGGLVQTLLTA